MNAHLPVAHGLRRSAFGWTILAGLLYCCGCMNTALQGRSLEPEVLRLAEHNPRPLNVRVACPVDEIVGHQYLFVLIPFGRLSIPAAEQILADTAYTRAALLGYSPRFDATGGPELTIRCTTVSVSAYDFLFTRRAAVTVSLSGEARDAGGIRNAEVTEESTEFRRFAFGPILEHKLAETFDIAVDKLLHKLETTGG